jgi:hypothetical protein
MPQCEYLRLNVCTRLRVVFITMPSRVRDSIDPFRWHHVLIVSLIRLFTIPGLWLSKKNRIRDGVELQSITVPSRDKGRIIKVDLYLPEGYDSRHPTPALIHWHGLVLLAS